MVFSRHHWSAFAYVFAEYSRLGCKIGVCEGPGYFKLNIRPEYPEWIGECDWEDGVDHDVECPYSKDSDKTSTEYKEYLYMVRAREDV